MFIFKRKKPDITIKELAASEINNEGLTPAMAPPIRLPTV